MLGRGLGEHSGGRTMPTVFGARALDRKARAARDAVGKSDRVHRTYAAG